MKILLQVEHYSDAIPEMRDLYPDHYQEIAVDQDAIKLDPNYETYLKLDRLGMLHLVTARNEAGRLVGYHLAILDYHMHYQDCYVAKSDIFFLKKDYRTGTNGIRLFRFVEQELRRIGVMKFFTGCKTHHNLSVIFRRLKYNEQEIVFAKLL